ncbi:MAG: hypothetical protein R2785_04090 [Flavobacteriaceae bacterium]
MKINQYFITNDDSVSLNHVDFSVNTIDKFRIYSHKKLKVNQFEKSDTRLVVLGDIYNPFQPNFLNADIGASLVEYITFTDILKAIDKLTGRFVLFIKVEGKYYIVSDFFGQRQVYYWFKDNNFYASSSDKLLLDTLGLSLEMNAIKQQLSILNYFLKIHEHWLLGKTDWDNRFMKLLPNHYLNIDKAEDEHIPVFVTKTQDKKELENEVLSILKNSIEAYSNRYDLKLGLTSGYDSRLLLASSLPIKEKIKYFTFNRNDTYVKRDVSIAKQLAETYQLDYKTIETEALTSEFISQFSNEFIIPRILEKTKNIQWFKNQDLKNTAVVSGNGGALIRSIYNEQDFKTNESICKAIEYEPKGFHLKALNEWLSTAKKYASENTLLLSDLFYLEIRLGKWGNKMVHELDISGIEEFTPYNNRHIMFSLLLNHNEAERKTITLNLLEQSVEGITSLPFNPKTWKDTVKKIIFYEHYKKWIQKIK